MLVMTRRNKIKKILKDRDISIYQLAKDTGLTYQTVHALTNSDQIPDGTAYGTLRKVAEVLGVSVSDLEVDEE